jgi:UDP-3-O-[3-hydroxymyristoyl] glucosamine N-acyltransferase
MQSFLDMLPVGYREAFGISEILNPERLADARATAFTWAEQPGRVCLGLNRKYYDEGAANPNIVAIICPRVALSAPPAGKQAVVVTEKADELFYAVHNLAFHEASRPAPVRGSIHPSARIAKSAVVGPEVSVGENSVVGEGAFIAGPVQIGADCVIHAHAAIGTDGLFAKTILGRKVQVRHFGGVRIGDRSVIHTAANVARSVNFGEATRIGREVHVGIHVNIGHDCSIGDRSEISGLALIAGRVEIEEDCWIGANAVISNALTMGKGSKVRIGSVVIDDLPAGSDVSGNFALPHAARLKEHLAAKRR